LGQVRAAVEEQRHGRDGGANPDRRSQSQDATAKETVGGRALSRIGDDEAIEDEENLDADPSGSRKGRKPFISQWKPTKPGVVGF
jgi:hypothetical protein